MMDISPEMWKVAEAECFLSHEGSMCTVVKRDGDAPPGSRTSSCMEGYCRNWRGPTGSVGLVSGGGQLQGTAGAEVRAEVGSRTGA